MVRARGPGVTSENANVVTPRFGLIFSWVRLFSRRERVEDRALTPDSLPPSMIISTGAGETAVSGRTALQLADVFACVRALVMAAVLCPLRAYRDTETGRLPLAGGRGPALLREPQPGMTQAALIAKLVQ